MADEQKPYELLDNRFVDHDDTVFQSGVCASEGDGSVGLIDAEAKIGNQHSLSRSIMAK